MGIEIFLLSLIALFIIISLLYLFKSVWLWLARRNTMPTPRNAHEELPSQRPENSKTLPRSPQQSAPALSSPRQPLTPPVTPTAKSKVELPKRPPTPFHSRKSPTYTKLKIDIPNGEVDDFVYVTKPKSQPSTPEPGMPAKT